MTISDKMKSEGVKALLQCDDETYSRLRPERLTTFEGVVMRVYDAMWRQWVKDIHFELPDSIQSLKKE